MAQGSVIEGVSDSALCIFILSVSSVAGLLGYEYIKAMEYSRVSSGGSLQEPSAMEALWAYLLGYSEPQLILPANAAGRGDHSRTRAEGFERGQVSLAGGERSEQRDCAIPTCPICLENVEYGIETSCGHAFCGKCFCSYWQNTNACRRRLKCPLDRRTVYAVFSSQALRSRDQPESISTPHLLLNERREEKLRIDTLLRMYNSKFNQPAPFEYIRWIARAFRQWELLSLGLRTYITILLYGLAAYIILPLDVVPEMVFGPLGIVDDLLILLLVICHLGSAIRTAVVVQGIFAPQRVILRDATSGVR